MGSAISTHGPHAERDWRDKENEHTGSSRFLVEVTLMASDDIH